MFVNFFYYKFISSIVPLWEMNIYGIERNVDMERRKLFADENSMVGIGIARSRSSCRMSAWALFPSVVI